MMRPALVVFDMIGTTIEANDCIPHAFAQALDGAGVALTDDDIRSIRGKSKRAAIIELLDGRGDPEAVYDAFRSNLLDYYGSAPLSPINGAEDAFGWCHAGGTDIALTTGFDSELAMLVLDRLGWTGRVDTVVCNDDVDHGRPAPDLILTAMGRLGHIDVARVASVGDTVSDLEAGANAGTGWNIGVLSGAHTRELLEQAPHTALIDSVATLPEVFVNA